VDLVIARTSVGSGAKLWKAVVLVEISKHRTVFRENFLYADDLVILGHSWKYNMINLRDLKNKGLKVNMNKQSHIAQNKRNCSQ